MNSLDVKGVLERLVAGRQPVNAIQNYSSKPGIYAVGFRGKRFPLASASSYVKANPIIYIGKTESNQLQRDKNTHFASGKSGSSTLRRSIGALLREEHDLQPVPRNPKEKTDRKFRNYKFTPHDEDMLTDWMNKNLSLAYWEFEGTKAVLTSIETQLIGMAIPVLNIQKNPKSPFKQEVSAKRRQCRDLAEQYALG